MVSLLFSFTVRLERIKSHFNRTRAFIKRSMCGRVVVISPHRLRASSDRNVDWTHQNMIIDRWSIDWSQFIFLLCDTHADKQKHSPKWFWFGPIILSRRSHPGIRMAEEKVFASCLSSRCRNNSRGTYRSNTIQRNDMTRWPKHREIERKLAINELYFCLLCSSICRLNMIWWQFNRWYFMLIRSMCALSFASAWFVKLVFILSTAVCPFVLRAFGRLSSLASARVSIFSW